jgi:negative regulator of flagellin synthesis FlgM
MKIDNSVKGLAPRGGSAAARPAVAAAKGPEPASPQVELTGANKLQQSSAAAASNGAFDAKRVAEIRLAISEGRFQVNPERIADGLLDSVRDMLSQRQRPADA